MSKKKKITTSTGVEVRHKPLGLRIWNNRGYYLMFLPVFVFILIMYYWPMLGIRYAFYDYKPVGAPTFVGLKHFYSMFKTDAFWSALWTTALTISPAWLQKATSSSPRTARMLLSLLPLRPTPTSPAPSMMLSWQLSLQ